MTPFTNEEYEIMIHELIEVKPMVFDMMSELAYRILTPNVKKWCYDHTALRGRQFEDDLIQEIIINRLMKYCVTHFLRREDRGFAINHDPVEFTKWVTSVGKNYVRSFAERQQKRDNRTKELKDRFTGNNDDSYVIEEKPRLSERAFHITFSAPRRVHIVLTWIALSSVMIVCDTTKIKATQLMEAEFSNKTLSRMWKDTQKLIRAIPWLTITEEEIERIEVRLKENVEDVEPEGSKLYKEYFGERGGRAAISDWVYRMNSWIKPRLNYESFDD